MFGNITRILGLEYDMMQRYFKQLVELANKKDTQFRI